MFRQSLQCYILTSIVLLPRLSESANCASFKSNTTIQGPPVMTELKNTKPILYHIWYTGRFASLRCCTSGRPLPNVAWYKNNHKLDLFNSRFKLLENNQSLLIKSLKTADSGRYSCHVGNKFGNQSRQFSVKVKSALELQKPVVILKPELKTVLINSNVTLNCVIKKSSRRPFILWHFNSTLTRPLFSGRYVVSMKKVDTEQTWISNLTITNITLDDEGVYICVARNGYGGPAQDSLKLRVEEPRPLKDTYVPPRRERSTWSQEGPVLSTVIGGLFVIILVISALWWFKKKRSISHGMGMDFPADPTAERNNLITANGVICEVPTVNIPLLRSGVDETIDFDVFISYSSQDRDFVKCVLFDELATTHSVCIDFKDFQIGSFIGDNILNSIYRSRKTLLVVSKNFLGGVWTYFEMQIAQGRLAQGHDVLIPVIIEEISFDEFPKPLQYYRQTKTYLEYFNEDVKPHFWDRLRNALGPSIQEQENNPPDTQDDNDTSVAASSV